MVPHLSHSLKSGNVFQKKRQQISTRQGLLQLPSCFGKFVLLGCHICHLSRQQLLLAFKFLRLKLWFGVKYVENFAASITRTFPRKSETEPNIHAMFQVSPKVPWPQLMTETKQPPKPKPAWLWTAKSLSFKTASCSASSTDLVTWEELYWRVQTNYSASILRTEIDFQSEAVMYLLLLIVN